MAISFVHIAKMADATFSHDVRKSKSQSPEKMSIYIYEKTQNTKTKNFTHIQNIRKIKAENRMHSNRLIMGESTRG